MVHDLLLGTESWSFLGSVALRTTVMFVVLITGLRIMGKRGVRQLSVFELGVIIGLGSAAGDPMFYRDVGLIPCIVVFAVVIALHHVLEVTLNRNPRLADRVEGSPVEVIRDGRLLVDAIEKEVVTAPEIFTQLRLQHIAHLGQVRRAILEPNGEVSVFFAPDDAVKPGMPIVPALHDERVPRISVRGNYSCAHCGYTLMLEPGPLPGCPSCERVEWIRALDDRRIT